MSDFPDDLPGQLKALEQQLTHIQAVVARFTNLRETFYQIMIDLHLEIGQIKEELKNRDKIIDDE